MFQTGLLKQPGSAYGVTLKHCVSGALLGDESCDPCPPRSQQNTLDTTVITNSPSKMYSGRSAAAAQRRESLSGLLLSPSSVHTGEQPCLRGPQLSLKPSSLHSLLLLGNKKRSYTKSQTLPLAELWSQSPFFNLQFSQLQRSILHVRALVSIKGKVLHRTDMKEKKMLSQNRSPLRLSAVSSL